LHILPHCISLIIKQLLYISRFTIFTVEFLFTHLRFLGSISSSPSSIS